MVAVNIVAMSSPRSHDVQRIHRRYRQYAGFVTTPRYFDDSPQQFLDVAPQGTGVLQRVNHVDRYDYRLSQRAANFDLLEESAVCLGQSFCDVIGQVGSNWVHVTGTTPTEIEAICDRISEAAGARFFMAGHSLVEGLRHIGAETITIANGYYRPDWSEGINGYLEQAGFKILWAGDLIDQGLVADHDEKLAIEEATLWDYPNHLMIGACVDAYRRAPQADAVVQTGAGFRAMHVVDSIEGETGTPLVASDFALYWSMLNHLGTEANPGYGYLLGSLSASATEGQVDG